MACDQQKYKTKIVYLHLLDVIKKTIYIFLESLKIIHTCFSKIGRVIFKCMNHSHMLPFLNIQYNIDDIKKNGTVHDWTFHADI